MLYPLVVPSTNFKNCRRLSRSGVCRLANRTRTPKHGLLWVTMPFNMIPLTQILPFATHRPISSSIPGFTGEIVSTKQPPSFVFERFPQPGASEHDHFNS